MQRKRRHDVEKSCSRRMFVAKLRRLADALERGERFAIRVAGETVRVPADAAIGIEHERGAGAEELEFQLTWSRR